VSQHVDQPVDAEQLDAAANLVLIRGCDTANSLAPAA
jgi:hypothetical protein